MVWGCITKDGPGRLHCIEGTMNVQQYCAILTESLLGTLSDYDLERRYVIFQQDNDLKHTSRLSTSWFSEQNLKVLPWPPNSPDMNIIEHVWDYLDCCIRARQDAPSNLTQLWKVLQDEWAKLDIEYIQRLYQSLPARVSDMMKAQGGYTKY